MNGVHDMGGMQGMGPVLAEPEQTEPVFHETWEGRVLAINTALRALKLWNLDTWRFQIEQLPAAEYLRMSYYEKWLTINEQLVVKHGLVSAAELAAGKADPDCVKSVPVLNAEAAAVRLDRGVPSSIDPSIPPLFKAGQRVRARNIHPLGHTRLPRYVRGKVGTIERDHGVYDFPDTNAHLQGTMRQHVYAVRFTARELWGEHASAKDTVCVDLWDHYLENA